MLLKYAVGSLDLMNAIGFSLGIFVGYADFLASYDVVGDLRCFHSVTGLIGLIRFH